MKTVNPYLFGRPENRVFSLASPPSLEIKDRFFLKTQNDTEKHLQVIEALTYPSFDVVIQMAFQGLARPRFYISELKKKNGTV